MPIAGHWTFKVPYNPSVILSCLLMEWWGFFFSSCYSQCLLVASHLSLSDFVLKGGLGRHMVQELVEKMASKL